MTQEQIITAIKLADIKNDEWLDLLNEIDDLYARGYISRLLTELGNALDSTSEEYREAVLEVMEEYDIWDKS